MSWVCEEIFEGLNQSACENAQAEEKQKSKKINVWFSELVLGLEIHGRHG